MRRFSTRFSWSSNSSSRCPPMRTGRANSLTNGSSRVRMPLCPSSSNFHVVSASVAKAVVMATPVTTILGKPFPVANFDDVVMGPTNASFLGCPALPRKREVPPPRAVCGPRRRGTPCSVPSEGQRDVVSAETERVVDGVLVLAITWLARDDVEVDLRIGRGVVKCRRNNAISQRKHRQDRFKRAHGADGVTQRPLGRVDRGLLTAGDPDGVGLGRVADRSGGRLCGGVVG